MEKCRLSDYDYFLPEELIAQKPLDQRDRSRMLVLDRQKELIEHSNFSCLPQYLHRGDLLVLNDTRVIPARLEGIIAGKGTEAEILLLHRKDNGNWLAMVKPGRRLKPGVLVNLGQNAAARIEGYEKDGLREISFDTPRPLKEMLSILGKVPLPPYIRRPADDPCDTDDYQTVYASREGSAAAPTAGFHFTRGVFTDLEAKGVEKAFITLHIGPGTFQPVKSEDIRDHVMHSEFYQVNAETAHILNEARSMGRRLVAVGTTACRVLETACDERGYFKAKEGWTDLYIYPGYTFKAVGAMLTNFHLPRSTLLMLISALAGYERVMEAYRVAVDSRYRFYSFGDCMLIL